MILISQILLSITLPVIKKEEKVMTYMEKFSGEGSLFFS